MEQVDQVRLMRLVVPDPVGQRGGHPLGIQRSMRGVELARAIRTDWPAVRVLALSMFHDHATVAEVLEAGEPAAEVPRHPGDEDDLTHRVPPSIDRIPPRA